MNDAPVKLITISGIFCAPDNRPVPGVTLKLRTRKYTNRLFQNEEISCVTGRDGEYSFSVLPGDYEAACLFRPDERAGVLGVVHVEPYSENGTLNDFLGLTAGMTYPPSIMIKIIEWVDLAEYYAEQAKEAAEAAGVNPRGNYDDTASYAINDLVFVDGNEYRATAETTAIAPPAAPWELFLTKGDNGPANVLTIGTVETLPAGSAATAAITGEAPEQTLNLGLPAGAPGDAGPANVLTIGTVETLPAGSDATVTITGSAPSQAVNFGIPQGAAGSVISVDGLLPNPAGNVDLGVHTFELYPTVFNPTLRGLVETAYMSVESTGLTINLKDIESANAALTLPVGYTLRLALLSNYDSHVTFSASNYINWIDGTNRTKTPSLTVSAGHLYLMEVVAVRNCQLFVLKNLDVALN